MPGDLQPEVEALIRECLAKESKLRPTFGQVLDRLSAMQSLRPSAEAVAALRRAAAEEAAAEEAAP